ncbi:MAG TPA: hypothetical protein VMT45_13875 [Thermoanaerobaculaceae bacterium]|nr:hypothetical protein [Thermoanaerobaculaceae bacterium]
MRIRVLATVLSLGFLAAATAQAQPLWRVVSLDTTGCNSGNIGFTTELSGVTFPTTLHFHTIVDSGGLRYMDEDAGTPGSGNGTYGWHLYTSSSGGPITGTFPIPPDQPITVTFDLMDGSGGPVVSHVVVILSKCDGGQIESDSATIPALQPVGLAVLAVLLAVGAVLFLRRQA